MSKILSISIMIILIAISILFYVSAFDTYSSELDNFLYILPNIMFGVMFNLMAFLAYVMPSNNK